MSRILLLICLVATLTGVKPADLEIQPTNWDEVTIYNFHWPADAAEMENIPDQTGLIFHHADIDIVPENFTSQFEQCTNLNFYHGIVKTVFIGTALEQIEIWNSSTEAVIIDRERDYNLKSLTVRSSRLTRIPENINQLKKLSEVAIYQSLIEFILFDEFRGLNELKKIDLWCNGIKVIQSQASFSLPKLSAMYFQWNLLREVDLCSVSLPSLEVLLLNNNSLTHFPVGHFPTLRNISLWHNPLNCEWKENLLHNTPWSILWGVSWPDFNCDMNSEGDFSLNCPGDEAVRAEDHSKLSVLFDEINSYDSKDELREQITALQEQNSELNNRLAAVERKNAELMEEMAKFVKINEHCRHLTFDDVFLGV